MNLLHSATFDPSKQSLLLYFQLAMSNKLFGHTLKSVYLPFFRDIAERQNLNLVIVSLTSKRPEYFSKGTDCYDAIATITDGEDVGVPETYRARFEKLDLTPLIDLNPVKLVTLTSPLVLRDQIKKKSFDHQIDRKQSNMQSITMANIQLLGGAWLATQLKMPLDHVIVDPLEANYNDLQGFDYSGVRYFLYESKLFDTKALHIAEYHYRKMAINSKKRLLDGDEGKTIDIVVGYSITQKPRLWLQDYDFDAALYGSGLKYHVFLKDNYREIDTFIWDKQAYLNILASTKFTLMIPSYEIEAFSTIRYIESLANGTIPLILDRCNLTEAFTLEEQEMLKPLVVYDTNIVKVLKCTSYDETLAKLQGWFLRDKPLQITL